MTITPNFMKKKLCSTQHSTDITGAG